MKAYVYREERVPWKMEEVPEPQPGPQDVLVKIEAAGVCGTDVGYYSGETKPRTSPLIPGHEIAGTVASVGDEVEGLAVGDRVCVHYIISCARCRHCDAGNDNRCRNRCSIGAHVDGGFAEYIAVPARNAFKLPDSVPFEEGAIIGCAVSTAYHALNMGKMEKGDTVAVFGLGGVGMHVVRWAKILGAGLVVGVDVVDEKLEAAKRFGADVVLHSTRDKPAEHIRYLTEGYGADMALECSGHPASMREAIQCLHGKSVYESGRLVGVAVFLDSVVIDKTTYFREGAFIRSGDHTREELRQVIQLAASGRIDLSSSITHRVPFTELNHIMEALEEKKEGIIRAVLV